MYYLNLIIIDDENFDNFLYHVLYKIYIRTMPLRFLQFLKHKVNFLKKKPGRARFKIKKDPVEKVISKVFGNV